MLAANVLVQNILSNRAETKREISWASMDRSDYKTQNVPKHYRREKDSEIVPNVKKFAFLFISSQLTAETVRWQNEGCTGLKSSSKREGWKKV